jgi:tRNA-dihydrouridine synthase A
MLGRAAYHNTAILADVDRLFHGEPQAAIDWVAIRDTMMDYAAAHIANGGRLANVTRHMIGLFVGVYGARRFRQILSSDASRPGASPEVIALAFAAIGIGIGATAGQAAE